MLFLVGLGLSKADLSVRALDAISKAGILYVESYTAPVEEEYFSYLESSTGKKIIKLERSDLEENAEKTVAKAANADIAIMAPGDPLIATTHHILLDAAHRANIKVHVFHAASIFSAAIGASGLDIYKFGPTTTIPFWSERYRPTSFLDVISKNKSSGEHTLLLLDVDQKRNATMGISEAMNILTGAAGSDHAINGTFLVLSDIGAASEEIVRTSLESSKSTEWERFRGRRISIIIPAQTSFAEDEAIRRFSEVK